MAEPTLRDVLDVLSKVQGDVSELRRDVSTVQSELVSVRSEVVSVRAEVARVDAKVDGVNGKVDALHADMTRRFDELDEELTKHAELHRRLETDVEALKRRPSARPTMARRSRGR